MFSLWLTSNSEKEKKIFLRLSFLSYFNVLVCHYLREKKRHSIWYFKMSLCHDGKQEYLCLKGKKYKPLSSAQNSTEGPTLHVHTEINEMSESDNCQVWSLVKVNYSLALGPKQKTCKPKTYLLKTHPTALFFGFLKL